MIERLIDCPWTYIGFGVLALAIAGSFVLTNAAA